MKPLHYAMLAIMLFFGVVVLTNTLSHPRSAPPTTTQMQSSTNGQVLYIQYCAACHGANLQGQSNWQTARADGSYPAPPHDASGHTWHHTDAYLIAITLQGGAAVTGTTTNAMPAFANQLTPADAKAIIDYIKSTWPADVRAQQAALNP